MIDVLPITRPECNGSAITNVQRAGDNVVIFSPIRPFRRLKFHVACGLVPIGITYGVRHATTSVSGSQVSVSGRRPFRPNPIAVCERLSRVQAFRLVKLEAGSFSGLARMFPLLRINEQVGARVLVHASGRGPFLFKFVPGSLQIARVL